MRLPSVQRRSVEAPPQQLLRHVLRGVLRADEAEYPLPPLREPDIYIAYVSILEHIRLRMRRSVLTKQSIRFHTYVSAIYT